MVSHDYKQYTSYMWMESEPIAVLGNSIFISGTPVCLVFTNGQDKSSRIYDVLGTLRVRIFTDVCNWSSEAWYPGFFMWPKEHKTGSLGFSPLSFPNNGTLHMGCLFNLQCLPALSFFCCTVYFSLK